MSEHSSEHPEQHADDSVGIIDERYFSRFPLIFAFIGLCFIVPVALVFALEHAPGYGDFTYFYGAASLAGTSGLESDTAFQHSVGILIHQHITHGAFPYLPGFVYPYWLIAHLPVHAAYLLQCATLLACALLSARLIARVLLLSPAVSALLTFAWMPTIFSIAVGQNSVLGLTLALFSWSCFEQQPLLSGIAAGLLCYKPIYGIPLIVLFFVRRQWKAVLGVALTGLAWYAMSALATGGNVLWPLAYLHLLQSYAPADLQHNYQMFIGLSSMLGRLGLPKILVGGLWGCTAAWFLWVVQRVSVRQAWALALAMITALSPHAFVYDAVFTLPALLLLLTPTPPLRMNPLYIVYSIIFGGMFMREFAVSPATVVTLGVPLALLIIMTRHLYGKGSHQLR